MEQRTNLVPAIKEIQAVIQRMTDDYQKAIKPYQDSLRELRRLNETCEDCEGRGWVLRQRACAEDDRPDPDDPRDRVRCLRCGGTGSAGHNPMPSPDPKVD